MDLMKLHHGCKSENTEQINTQQEAKRYQKEPKAQANFYPPILNEVIEEGTKTGFRTIIRGMPLDLPSVVPLIHVPTTPLLSNHQKTQMHYTISSLYLISELQFPYHIY